jgi:hypothetical protein
VVPQGLAGQELELLRASQRPEPVAGSWSADPLHEPVAALPLDEGLHTLVLDAPSPASWRLLEIELATGELQRELASGTGAPTTLAAERDGNSVLIAATLSAAWRLVRVELASGASTVLITQDDVVRPGELRGLASLGTQAALVTLGDALVRLDWSEAGSPRATTVVAGLATPWGVVLDPLREGWAYVAEHDALGAQGVGRVVAVDLEAHRVAPLVGAVPSGGGPSLPRPRDLALARQGNRLLALCDTGADAAELRALDVGAAAPNPVGIVSATLASTTRSLATGPDDLVILVGGGKRRLAGRRRDRATADDPGARAREPARASAAGLRPAAPAQRSLAHRPSARAELPGNR